MVKAGAPWLRSLLRAGKKQQRAVSRAMKLLAGPKPASKPKPQPKPQLAQARKAATPSSPEPRARSAARPVGAGARAVSPRRALRTTVAPAAPATGKWLASHYPGFIEQGALPVRPMSYWLYLPERARAEGAAARMPLVVMLHGCDQTASGFAQGTRMNALAEKQGYAVLYPQQSLGTHPHRCWKWYDRATQQGGGDVPAIVGIVNEVSERYHVDRSRVYICGISAGAGMANIVALNHPDLFAGLGLHSGPMFGAGHSTVGALAVMRHGAGQRAERAVAEVLEKRAAFPPMPTILIQGEDDTVVRPINQDQLARQAMIVNQLPLDSPVEVVLKAGNRRRRAYQLRDVYRNRKLMLRVAHIAELKHAWSGGDERLSYNSGAGPDASRMMLDFFARHRRVQVDPGRAPDNV